MFFRALYKTIEFIASFNDTSSSITTIENEVPEYKIVEDCFVDRRCIPFISYGIKYSITFNDYYKFFNDYMKEYKIESMTIECIYDSKVYDFDAAWLMEIHRDRLKEDVEMMLDDWNMYTTECGPSLRNIKLLKYKFLI